MNTSLVSKNYNTEPISKIVDYSQKIDSNLINASSWKNRYEECNDKYLKLEEANKLQEFTINLLNKEIEDSKSTYSLKIEEAIKLNSNEISEKNQLKNRITELKLKLAIMEPDLSGVFKPTKSDMSQTLIDLKPLLEKVASLHLRITSTRISVHTTCELIWSRQANQVNLKASLNENDLTYNPLVSEYLELSPKIKNALLDLDEKIKNATHLDVSQAAVNCMSAMNDLPLILVETNKKNFKALLLECTNVYNKLDKDLTHINKQYNEATNYLNKIDHNHGCIKHSTWGIEHAGKVFRYSPTNPTYKFDTEKEAVRIALKAAEKKANKLKATLEEADKKVAETVGLKEL